MQKTTLLMTRPQAAAERFVQALPANLRDRVDPCYAPLVEIVPITVEIDLAGVKGVIFTSINGVQAASALTARRDVRVYCVGSATTREAIGSGWNARMMGQDAAELIPAMTAEAVDAPLLHLSGRHVRTDIAKELSALGYPSRRQVVYDQKLLTFDKAVQDRIAGPAPVIAPVFSPRTAEQLAAQSPENAHMQLIALSSAVAEPLARLQFSPVTICTRPDAQEMAHQVEKVLNLLCRVESVGGAK
ncbi:uroporphyrinogen-III synthase [Rhodobacteraceae bacterium F11138]|nr:uroporphyrinogen-III synthase [Rhodobacteraceae bacterium F11138]